MKGTMFIYNMPFWLVDCLDTALTLSIVLAIICICVYFVAAKSNAVKIMRLTTAVGILSACTALVSTGQSWMLNRRFLLMFHERTPETFAQRIERSPQVIEILKTRRDIYERARSNYIAEKAKTEIIPQETAEEIRDYIDARRSLQLDWEGVNVRREGLLERVVVAYAAGFQEEAVCTRCLPFDEPDPELPHRKFTK